MFERHCTGLLNQCSEKCDLKCLITILFPEYLFLVELKSLPEELKLEQTDPQYITGDIY